ncbi:MAG: type II secretion system F family protein [Candidatus Dormibacteraeota bacterium]|nr:type II secretion system F family protein [Candidatus Dormibacteraeota bacterium]
MRYDVVVIGACLGAAILVFSWSLDTLRREQVGSELIIAPLPRRRRQQQRDIRERVDRLMQPVTDRLTERSHKAGKSSLADELIQSGLHITSSEFLLGQIALAAGLAAVGIALRGVGPEFLLLAWLGYIGPILYMRNRQAARHRAFALQLGNTLTLLSNALKTGYSLGQAIEIMARKAPHPVSDEFALVTSAIQFGASIEDALAALVKRVQSSDLDFIVVAILLHRKVGGNLPEILDNIAETIRERLRMKQEMSVLTAHARASSSLISALPVILGLLMFAITPAYFKPMIESPIGIGMLVLAGFLVILGNVLMRRLARVAS